MYYRPHDSVTERVMVEHLSVANIILIVLLLLGVFVMWRAGRDGTFKWSDMLRDGEGKPSASRLGIFVSLAVSSYVVMVMATKIDSFITDVLFWFLLTWSGTLIFVKIVDKWDGRTPFTRHDDNRPKSGN
jgi:hypothetical protein